MKQKSGNKSTQEFAKLSPNKRVKVEKLKPPVKPLRHAKDKQDDLLPASLTRAGKGGAAKAAKTIPGEGLNGDHVMVSKKVIEEIQSGIARMESAFGALANALRVLE